MTEKPEVLTVGVADGVEVTVFVVQVCFLPEPVQAVVVDTSTDLVAEGVTGVAAVHWKFAGETTFGGACTRWTGRMFWTLVSAEKRNVWKQYQNTSGGGKRDQVLEKPRAPVSCLSHVSSELCSHSLVVKR